MPSANRARRLPAHSRSTHRVLLIWTTPSGEIILHGDIGMKAVRIYVLNFNLKCNSIPCGRLLALPTGTISIPHSRSKQKHKLSTSSAMDGAIRHLTSSARRCKSRPLTSSEFLIVSVIPTRAKTPPLTGLPAKAGRQIPAWNNPTFCFHLQFDQWIS